MSTKSKKLTTNQEAPAFAATSVQETAVDLASYQGRKVYLAFLRNVDCIMCNLRLHQLIQRKELQDENLKVILFLQSEADQIRDMPGYDTSFPFEVVADPGKKIYQQYGLKSSVLGYLRSMLQMGKIMKAMLLGIPMKIRQRGDDKLMPADFLIDEKGNIVTAYYGNASGDHLALDDIVGFAQSKTEAADRVPAAIS